MAAGPVKICVPLGKEHHFTNGSSLKSIFPAQLADDIINIINNNTYGYKLQKLNDTTLTVVHDNIPGRLGILRVVGGQPAPCKTFLELWQVKDPIISKDIEMKLQNVLQGYLKGGRRRRATRRNRKSRARKSSRKNRTRKA